MNPRKKLIEVALPLAKINEAAAREKSIRHGHPSTLHLWWARRPLAACRAVLFASFVDDPDSDPAYRKPNGTVDEERAGLKRAALFNLIEELVQWENSNSPSVIQSARAEIARCVASRLVETGQIAADLALPGGVTVGDLVTRGHCRPIAMGVDKKGARMQYHLDTARLPPADAVNAFLAEHAPPVLDPFCGGGSIPLEAQRLGLRAYASDLNPVAVLITKALIEIPPKFAGRPPVNPDWQKTPASEKAAREWHGAAGLAEDVRYYGKWMRDEAEKRIGHLYPTVKITKEMAKDRPDLKEYVGEELTVIAWLWARTVASPNPAVRGVHVPLARSFWLSTRTGKKAYIEPIVDASRSSYHFDIRVGKGGARAGTIGRTGGSCLLTESPIPLEHIRREGRSGHLKMTLMAIVAEGKANRIYLPPIDIHARVAQIPSPSALPDTDLPKEALGFRVQNYGMTKHVHLFTSRQLHAVATLCNLVLDVRTRLVHEAGDAYADAVATYLGLAVSKLTDTCNSLVSWKPSMTQVIHLFTRQAIPMVWDFAEPNVLAGSAGDFGVTLGNILRVVAELQPTCNSQVMQRDAQAVEAVGVAESNAPFVFSTDPPYYDNVPYGDLSDFFYIWLRHCLQQPYPQLFSTVLVPKAHELVADPFRRGGKNAARAFFESGIAKVFSGLRKKSNHDYPTTIYYAFKQAEEHESGDEDDEQSTAAQASTGWETFLEGLAKADWQINGTWPMRTELGNRIRSMGSNALASSVVLVCRPRRSDASLATRKQFITELRHELPEALHNLQQGNIAPVDLAQAAIGPGMAVFTRYAKVMETDGSPMTVRTALGLINQALDEVLAEQEGEFDADTRWALAWFEQFGMDEGPFGVAETLSKAKNTAVNALVEAGVIAARGGKVRLVKRHELPDDGDPTRADRLSVWDTTQHLIRALDRHGEAGAAALMRQLGGAAETARDLAYRLYLVCERKKWAEEALAYNGLVIAWPELTKLAIQPRGDTTAQGEMF